MENQALKEFLAKIREQIQLGETQIALDSLQSYLAAASVKLKNELSLQISRYNRLRRDERKGVISRADSQAEQARLDDALLEFLDEIPKFIKPEASPSAVVKISSNYPEPGELSVEKIIGINNLRQISWIQRGLEVSKSVCRILTPVGYGSGFLIGADRLMTNNHVIPSPEIANQSYAEFNYQQDLSDNYLLSHRFRLSGALFRTSPVAELDYTIVGLETSPESLPLSAWGHLQLNPNANPIPTEHVSIIQHPNGGLKQIVLTANQVINSSAQYLFYTTDTMGGSSGSPVFNDLWQVIAIHHADGGVKQDPKGNHYFANEGILMSAIKPHAGDLWPKQ